MKKRKQIRYRGAENKKQDIWSYLPGANLGIFRKFLISFLLIALLPLIIFGVYSYTSIKNFGDSSVENVRNSFDEKTREALEFQASLVAEQVKNFLYSRIAELKYLETLPVDASVYLSFYDNSKSLVWLPDGSGNRQSGKKFYKYLYKEIEFVSPDGMELTKISDGRIVNRKQLKNIKNPKHTRFKGERYFEKVKKLKKGEVFVSHLNGYFIKPSEQFETEESRKTFSPDKYYDGVIRMAMPKYINGRLAGYLILALDHVHLMEFTQHLLPNSKDRVVFPDYNSGDYAFMFDDEGWIITHPKFWDIRGFDRKGNLVPAYNAKTPYSIVKEGRIPFNLDSAGFIHPNYPLVAQEIRMHRTGSVVTQNVGGVVKVMAFAPIEFNEGVYGKYGIFGGITIGSELHRFRGSAELVASELHDNLMQFLNNLFIFSGLTVIVILFISWFFSRSYSKPIQELTDAVQQYSEGNLETSVQIDRNDELGVLSNSFNIMAYELKKNREELLDYVEQLKESKKQSEIYAVDLEYQLAIFSAIQKISNLLGSTFNIETLIKEILRTSVEAVGFDRAVLYLIDDNGKYLEYSESYGFTDKEKKFASKSKYNLNRADCIETRVANKGQIVFIPDFSHYEFATELDKKINAIAESKSFVYVPLRVKEKIIGIMGADKKRSGVAITEKDINSLQVLANQASRVIETARLYSEIVRQRNFVADVFENMLNGLITTDGKGNVTSFNSAANRILEFEGNVEGENVYELFPLNKTLLDEMTRELDEKNSYNGYARRVEINGKVKYLSFNISRINTHGEKDKTPSTIVVIQDQTERKHLEDHVQKMDRLISLGKFAAGIAHEIRNPLTGISLFLDDIHDKFHADETISGLIQNSLNEINRLENLIDEILDFAAPHKGERYKIDINRLLQSTTAFIEKQFVRNNKKIILELKENLPEIECESEKIRQAFLNIILNAERAIDEGGKLLLRTSYRKIRFADSSNAGKYVLVEFEDDGPGIKSEDREHIFDPFYSGFPSGTGLGLAIVHTIITEHDGKIFVSNSGFGGAKFSVYLPI